MSMTAGFPPDEVTVPAHTVDHVFEQRTDPIPQILTVGRDMPPGEAFSYSSRGSHLVSAVLREALIRADSDHPAPFSSMRARNSLTRWKSTPWHAERLVR